MQETLLQPLHHCFQGPCPDLAIEMFNVSMVPLLGFACQASAHVADLQLYAGRPEQVIHLEPSQDVGDEALELFEFRTPGVWLWVLEFYAGFRQRGLSGSMSAASASAMQIICMIPSYGSCGPSVMSGMP
jgi:hypothetical protein